MTSAEGRLARDTGAVHCGVDQLSEDLSVLLLLQNVFKPRTYSAFASAKNHGYGVYLQKKDQSVEILARF